MCLVKDVNSARLYIVVDILMLQQGRNMLGCNFCTHIMLFHSSPFLRYCTYEYCTAIGTVGGENFLDRLP